MLEFPAFPGAQSVVVGITGDMPPMDYVTPNGVAQGFNIELLREIALRLEININVIQVNSATRAIALETDKIDAIFWTGIVLNPDNPVAYSDVPEGTICTESYYESPFSALTIKDGK